MMGAQLHLFLFKLVHTTETITNGASISLQMCQSVHTNHTVFVLVERILQSYKMYNLVALFSLLPFRLCTFVYAGEAGQGLLSSASLLCLYCQAEPCYSTFSHCQLQFLTQPCIIMLCTIRPLPLFVLLQHQSFHSSVPGCLEDETLMIPMRILSHRNSK